MPKTAAPAAPAAPVWKLETRLGLWRLIDVKFKRIELISLLETRTNKVI